MCYLRRTKRGRCIYENNSAKDKTTASASSQTPKANSVKSSAATAPVINSSETVSESSSGRPRLRSASKPEDLIYSVLLPQNVLDPLQALVRCDDDNEVIRLDRVFALWNDHPAPSGYAGDLEVAFEFQSFERLAHDGAFL